MRRGLNLAAGMGGLAILLAPAPVQSAIVYRTSGTACQVADNYSEFTYFGEFGLVMSGEYDHARAICPLPTSDATFMPSTLSQVNVRYYVNGSASRLTGTLCFHDHDSHDYVECAEDMDIPATGFGQLTLPKSCSGYQSTWGVVIDLFAANVNDSEHFQVKVVTAYD